MPARRSGRIDAVFAISPSGILGPQAGGPQDRMKIADAIRESAFHPPDVRIKKKKAPRAPSFS
jgi:hypothetical protein